MKFARVLAAAIVLLLALTGCTSRNSKDNDASGTLNDVVSDLEEGAQDLLSDVEEGAHDLGSDIEEGMSKLEEKEEDGDDGSKSPDEDELDDESVASAMSADFSEIGALDGTPDNGFPGGPVDDQNRPTGPLTYQEKYGQYDAHFIVPGSQKIFLTFDEGYENGYTAQILDTLKEKNVKAVFFVTYPYATSEPELIKRMIDEGHVIGNHSTAHKSFPDLPLSEAADDIMNLHDYIKSQFGYEMYLFRPPEGMFSEQVLALCQSLNYKTMLWSFAYSDWDTDNQPLTLEATDRIVSKAHPGEIWLLHAVSKTNAEILGDVIDQLRAGGYEFADYFYLT